MAITINGTGTITGISAGGLPDGSVTAADIESSLDLTGKTVTLPSGTGGKVLNIVSDNDNVDSQYNLGAYSATSDVLSVSITPTFANSKMLIMVHAMGGTDYSIMGARLMKDGSVMNGPNGDATDASNRWRSFDHRQLAGTALQGQVSFDTVYLETLSGASTSTAITYSVQLINTDNVAHAIYLNRGSNDTDSSVNRARTSSSLIVMEIAP